VRAAQRVRILESAFPKVRLTPGYGKEFGVQKFIQKFIAWFDCLIYDDDNPAPQEMHRRRDRMNHA
jgi:hypothetical protein